MSESPPQPTEVAPAGKRLYVILWRILGAILAVAVYAIVSSLGTLLFTRTSQQETSKARMAYGISGAFLGLCFAAFFIWLALAGVRTIG